MNKLDTWMIDELQHLVSKERTRLMKINGVNDLIEKTATISGPEAADKILNEIENTKTHPLGLLKQIQTRLDSIKANYGLILLEQNNQQERICKQHEKI